MDLRIYFYSMGIRIIETDDGSSSFYNEELDETYHSKHGAIQEANYVFLKMGLEDMLDNYAHIDLLEIGFGTGLNAWLTAKKILERNTSITYVGIEAFPIDKVSLKLLNYDQFSENSNEKELFKEIHAVDWELENKVRDNFTLIKYNKDFKDLDFKNQFDLIYFDAFGPRIQPELWTLTIFNKMYRALRVNGKLVTYSCKGDVRRAMIEAGFTVKKVPGPPGKREMLRARKVDQIKQ